MGQDSLRIQHWLADLATYQANLEARHMNLYHTISQTEFESTLQTIKAQLSQLTDDEIIIQLKTLTRKIGDGHTALPLWGMSYSVYPIEVLPFGNEWRVIKTLPMYKHLLGKKLIQIGALSIDQAVAKIAPICQFVENRHSLKARIPNYLRIAEVLHTLNMSSQKNQAQFTFSNDQGKKIMVSMNAMPNEHYNQAQLEQITPTASVKKPEDQTLESIWFAPIANTEAIYLKFSSYPSFEEMNAFGQQLLGYITAKQKRQLIIDFRGNYGGDFFIGLVLASYLNLADCIDWQSGVYVLTDRFTFSAAMNNAAHFRQILHGKIIGEPTGGNPYGYQDMGQFELPNSGLTVTYSKRFFRFQDQPSEGIQPDVPLEVTWEKYATGADEVLEWVMKDLGNQQP
ncbi:MAG: S41 family peptidase [Flammeovirgaceae bacterium]